MTYLRSATGFVVITVVVVVFAVAVALAVVVDCCVALLCNLSTPLPVPAGRAPFRICTDRTLSQPLPFAPAANKRVAYAFRMEKKRVLNAAISAMEPSRSGGDR